MKNTLDIKNSDDKKSFLNRKRKSTSKNKTKNIDFDYLQTNHDLENENEKFSKIIKDNIFLLSKNEEITQEEKKKYLCNLNNLIQSLPKNLTTKFFYKENITKEKLMFLLLNLFKEELENQEINRNKLFYFRLKTMIKKKEIKNFWLNFLKLLGIGDWGLGIGDWGLANPQSPIPNPHY
jgi:hypothetical protein